MSRGHCRSVLLGDARNNNIDDDNCVAYERKTLVAGLKDIDRVYKRKPGPAVSCPGTAHFSTNVHSGVRFFSRLRSNCSSILCFLLY